MHFPQQQIQPQQPIPGFIPQVNLPQQQQLLNPQFSTLNLGIQKPVQPVLGLGIPPLNVQINVVPQLPQLSSQIQNPLLKQNITQIQQQQQPVLQTPNPNLLMSLNPTINPLLSFDPLQNQPQYAKPMTATQIANQYIDEFKQQKQIQENITEEYEKAKKNIKKCDVHSQKPSSNCRQCKKNKELLDEIEEKYKKNLKGIQYQQKEEKNFKPNQNPNNIFPIYGDQNSGNLNQLLKNNVLNAQYFKDLYLLKSFNEILDELMKKATMVEPWQSGQHGIPSVAFCCLYKFILMKLTVAQIKYLQEFQGNSIVKCVGHLYIRYVCDPKYLWDWFSKYLLDDEEVRPTNNPKEIMTIGTFIENILADMNYYQTRLPRIPQRKSREIKALILMMQEKRQRKEENLQKLHLFRPGAYVLVESKQDQEWHPSEVLKLEGKYLRVRYVDYLDTIPRETRSIEELISLGIIQDQYSENKIFYGNDESIFIGDAKLLEPEEVEDLQRKYNKYLQKLEKRQKQKENQNPDQLDNEDSKQRFTNLSDRSSRSLSSSRGSRRSRSNRSYSDEGGSRSRGSSNRSRRSYDSRGRSNSGRSLSSRRSNSSNKSDDSRDSRRKNRSRSRSRDHRNRQHRRHNHIHRDRSRSRSYKRSKKDKRDKKLDEEYKNTKLEKYLAKVDELDKNQALINSKSDIRRPTSYKTSLSMALPKGSSRPLDETPPEIRTHEEFVEVNFPKERKEAKQFQKPKKDYQPSKQQIEKTKKLMEKYGDASAKQQTKK